MTSSSDRPGRSGSLYARFIPREELQSFKSWMPGSFEAPASAAAPAPRPDIPAAEHDALLHKARVAALEEGRAHGQREGYAQGHREGLAQLEKLKQEHAAQVQAQIGTLLRSIDAQFQALEGSMAQALAEAATRLARAVLRTELQTHPEAVVAVAQEAVASMLAGARQVRLLVHPDDLAPVRAGAGLELQARGVLVAPSPAVARGGCVLESELGRIDARIEQRWAQATQLLGAPVPWSDPPAAPPAVPEAPAALPQRPPEPPIELDLDLGAP